MKSILKRVLMFLGLYEVKIISEPVIKEIIKKEFVLLPQDRWNSDDASSFKRFLNSPTGLKFQAVLQMNEILANKQAALADRDYQHACGFAGGYMASFQTILELQNFKEQPIHVEANFGTEAYTRERLMS